MKKSIILLMLMTVCVGACKKEEACTEEFKIITVTITNFDGSPASFEELNLIRESNSDTISITNNGGAEYPLIDDSYDLAESENFLLRGYQQGMLVLSEPYIFGDDGCHVIMRSGKRNIALD